MRNDYTKHLSFLFPVPSTFFKDCVKVTKPFEINVIYTLDWRGVVQVEGYTVTPNMCRWINDWVKLEEELQHAAENNSTGYRVPGDWMSSKVPEEIATIA
jgi:hypothetical protein